MKKKAVLTTIYGFLMMGSGLINASEPTEIEQKLEKIDLLMDQSLKSLQIPGMAVGIVFDGKVAFLKGYGVKNISDSSPVTENTVFAIGSCSKAFTTFALGQMVDEGVLSWDDPVIHYLPEFRLYDIHATHHLTIRDLVTHRSGLPRHDLAWYGSTFSRSEILKLLPYLEPTYDLREKFQYNNLMYAVAGLVIEKVSGKTWEEFVEERIFHPLDMTYSNFSVDASQQLDDFASPHTKKSEPFAISFRNISNIGPAGSINSSVKDMMKWVEIQLAEGNLQGKPLIGRATLKDMHRIHMPLHEPMIGDSILGYGLGWFIGLHEGHYMVDHGGGIDGFISMVTLCPKEKIGVVILTNSDSHAFFPMMASYAIIDLLLDKEDSSFLSKVEEKEKLFNEMLKKSKSIKSASQENFLHPLEQYAGEFEHPGYGVICIDLKDAALFAKHHDVHYRIEPAGCDYIHLSMQAMENSRLEGSFVSNQSGDIVELRISFEAELNPIVFKRKTSNALIAIPYLKRFVGEFEGSFFSAEVALKGNSLTIAVPGQPSCIMKPEKLNFFSIKEIPNCKIEFVWTEKGKVSELQIQQAGHTVSLKKKI